MAYFSIVLSQIIGFVIYILIGIAAVRMRVLGSRSLGVFSRFITKISLPPALILQHPQRGDAPAVHQRPAGPGRNGPDVLLIIPALLPFGTPLRPERQ